MKQLIVILLICVVSSCVKDPKLLPPKTTNCPEMYDFRSEPYINLYKGTLNTGSIIPPDHIYPDKYAYSQPCVNPRNEFEFCYLRRENGIQAEDDLDLFKYNFCTGQTTFLTSHVTMMPDWSVKDWIVFTGQNRKIWKIKSNGDSLTELSAGGYRAQWNPSGTQFIFNGNQIADIDGKLIKTLNIQPNSNTWLNDSELIFNLKSNSTDDFEIRQININNDIQQVIYSEPKNGTSAIYRYNKKSKNLYFVISKDYLIKYGAINLESHLINTLGTFEQSFVPIGFSDVENNKVIFQQVLRDTMTGNIIQLNYRSHIAIMDQDGKNERQIMIPE